VALSSEPYERGHPNQSMRIRSAADALVAARTELRGQVRGSDAAMPVLYASRIVADDDRFGARCGYVVQGDAVSWSSLVALDTLAQRGVEAHRRDDEHPFGVTPLTCALCAAVFALDVRLVDGLRRLRTNG
jgi:hypothetical protein